jgi:acetyltransferase-like isoleucine patch superfamily enzyme
VVIHTTALLADDMVVGDDPDIGPYSILGCDGMGGPLEVGRACTIRSHVVIYRDTVIGSDFHAGHGALIRESSSLGHRVSVGSHAVVEHHVQLRDGVRLHSRCFIPEYSVLLEGAWVGPGVTVTNSRYPNRPMSKDEIEGVVVGAHAVVGASAVLLPGVRIGARAMVGAGAVVVRDVPDGVTVVGNPARELR